MDADTAVTLARNAVYLALVIASPVLVASIAVGLVISIIQAVTQIQEQTLSFVPKVVAMLFVLLFTLPWIINRMVEYSTNLIRDIPSHF
jgi:flagellar biosynthetic protein FliQ